MLDSTLEFVMRKIVFSNRIVHMARRISRLRAAGFAGCGKSKQKGVMPLCRPRKEVNINIDYHERVTLDDEHAGMAM